MDGVWSGRCHGWHMDALREWMESDLDVIMVGTWTLCSWKTQKNTACPEVFGMSNMRKCAKCRVYQIFRCTRSSSCARERDDGGYNKEAPKQYR